MRYRNVRRSRALRILTVPHTLEKGYISRLNSDQKCFPDFQFGGNTGATGVTVITNPDESLC
jgi:hypothetical protein